MEKLLCNGAENKYWLSYICTNGSDTTNFECFSKYYTQNQPVRIFRKVLGAWFMIVGTIGVFGNLYTLLSIPHAAKRNKFGLDRNFYTTTIFILHLCFIDFCHCVSFVWPTGLIYLLERWPFAPLGCSFLVITGQVTVSADMTAIALVSLTRCLNIMIPKKWDLICDKTTNLIMMMLSVWLLSIMSLFPYFFKSYGVEPGWDCEAGGCAFRWKYMINNNETVPSYIQDPEKICDSQFDCKISFMYLYFLIKYSFCILVCMMSYAVLLFKVHSSKKNLKGPENKVTNSDDTERRMSLTILMLITMNIVCLLPFLVYYVVGFEKWGTSRSFRASIQFEMVEALYVSQFALNFLVYVARSDQSRKAFVLYWQYIKSKLKINK